MEYVKEVFAQYDRQCIRVYQAYNPTIAKEAVALQTFGENFNLNRMTWIKPSFLWLMYRSNWGTKKNQECILALDIYQSKFNELLEKAVLVASETISKILFGETKINPKKLSDYNACEYCEYKSICHK